MCFFIWIFFSGERHGPWASCCWFFSARMGLLVWNYELFWQEISLESLIQRWPLRPVGLLLLRYLYQSERIFYLLYIWTISHDFVECNVKLWKISCSFISLHGKSSIVTHLVKQIEKSDRDRFTMEIYENCQTPTAFTVFFLFQQRNTKHKTWGIYL